MEQHEVHRLALKNQYAFSDWTRARHQASAPLERPFLPDHALLRGYRLAGRTAVPGTRSAFTDYLQSESDGAVTVAVSIEALPNNAAARERLVDHLARCMSPRVQRLTEAGIEAGDVGFGGGPQGDAPLFFLRGNVVVELHNTGTRRASLAEVAQTIDAQIVHLLEGLAR